MVTKVSDTVAGSDFEQLCRIDPNRNTGLTAWFFGGKLTDNADFGDMADQSVTLPDDAITDVYVDYDVRTISNTITDNAVIIYTVTTASGAIASWVDKRGLSLPKTFEAPPVFPSYNQALVELDPDHWWKFDEAINGLPSGLNVTDVGSAGTLYDGATDSAEPQMTQGNGNPDEWSYKFEKSQEIDWGTKSGGVIPADLAAASTGSYTYQFRCDQDDADAPSTEGPGILCIMERAADATPDNVWEVTLTQRGWQGDMPLNFKRLLTYRVETAATNFYQLQYELKDMHDGQTHAIAIVQDGVAVKVYLDGNDITAAMTETTGGTGIDATSWWTDVTPDVMRVGNSSNSPIRDLTHFGSHLAFFLTAISAGDANDLWETIEPLTVNQGTAAMNHFDVTSEWNSMMLKTKPTAWWPLNDAAGPLVREVKGGRTSTAFVSNSANVTFGGAGPGGAGMGHVVIANTSGDESAGIRMSVPPHGDAFDIKRYFGLGGWFYVDETSISDEVGLISALPRTVGNDGVRMWLTSGRLVRCLLWDSSTSTRRTTIESTAAVSLQAWHHVIWLLDDTAVGWRLFIDGTEDTTFTVDPDTTGSTSIIYGMDDQPMPASGIGCIGYQLDQGSTAVATFGTRMSQQSNLRMSNWALWNNIHSQSNSDDHQRLGLNATGNLISDMWDIGRGV